MDVPGHLQWRLAALAPAVGKVLVGVSGGADSVALLRGLVAAGIEVRAAHLDHALRDGSAEDAEFVADLAESLGVELLRERVDAAAVAAERGWNVEDAARRLRYDFLARSAKKAGAGAVITAHTLDDQAETVLMQLLRGAAYLRGMPEVRRRLVRPLLDVSRSDLESYLGEIGQGWREDPSNNDRRQLRAWLRHEILPQLRSRFPAVATRLAAHARVQHDVAAFLRAEAARLSQRGTLDRLRLERAVPAVQREAIRSLFDEAGVAPSGDAIEAVRLRLGRKHPYRMTLAPGVALRLAYDRLEIATGGAAPEERRVTTVEQLPSEVPAEALRYPDLWLRGRRPGDRMRLAGGSKSLARLMIDRKIPREERDALVVLASGSRVLWAEGIGLAADLERAVPGELHETADLRLMARALELAQDAAEAGELPVGAVVACDGEIVGEGHNQTVVSGDPTAHAEILAMRRAADNLGDWRLTRCTLYVTLEPCPMCAGAVLESHLPRLVYGAANTRDGAVGSVVDLLAAPWKRRVEVESGLLAGEAGDLLSSFFRERRRS